jgi:hypothetical protein
MSVNEGPVAPMLKSCSMAQNKKIIKAFEITSTNVGPAFFASMSKDLLYETSAQNEFKKYSAL